MRKTRILRHFQNKKTLMRAFALILCALAALGCGAPAFADAIDPNAESSLTISWKPDAAGTGESSFAGTPFRAYRVADVSSSVEFTPTEKFLNCGVNLSGLSAQEWLALAVQLAGMVNQNAILPDSAGLLGEDGTLMFPGINKTGLYLVVGEKYEGKNKYFSSQPALISVPDQSGEAGSWNYHVISALKYFESDKVLNLKVTKIWADAGYSSYRPSSVTVRILCDGEKFADVLLNAANNWTWTLENADPAKSWDVQELSNIAPYTTSYKRYDYDILTSFYITNTRAYTPLTPVSFGGYARGVGIGGRFLPQTGMLWWPVPILGVLGIACVLIGLKKRGEKR